MIYDSISCYRCVDFNPLECGPGMTIADDQQNPRPTRKLSKSLDAIAALRTAMEQRLAAEKALADRQPVPEPESVKPAPQQNASETITTPTPAPKTEAPVFENTFQKLSEKIRAESVKAQAPKAESPRTEAPKMEPPKSEKAKTGETPSFDPAEWPRVLFRIADKSQKLMHEFLERNKDMSADMGSFDPAHVSEAFAELFKRILNNPERFADAQLAVWQGYINIWQSALVRMQGKDAAPIITPSPGDKRFQDKDWQTVWMFDFIKQSYLLTAEWVHRLVRSEAETLDPQLAHKLQFYTKQMVDAVSPTNFWMTNPEVLRATLESGGENLIKGVENLLEDLERGHGMLRISMSDDEAFSVGKNIATTAGRVVYQNALMQLIQYEPRTATVAKTPMLIIPPWINKYYILDLREKNSFLRYAIDQGHTVFCISWVNPDARNALVNFDDYMSDGAITAMREIKRITGENSINALGYCIGGTVLACALAYLEAVSPRPDDVPTVASASYLVTMIDFEEPGDLGVFIDEDQIKVIEARMAKQGYLDAAVMATTFNMLRSNDLIWSFVINNYLLGREPFPFDILYWNADSTNLPAVMHSFYLRKMYLTNKLVEPNGVQMKGVPIDMRRITTPSFLLSTHDDHIAPWRSTYAATQLYKGPVTFCLAGSGHIAGVVNPPAANKYGYWTNTTTPINPDAWLENAEQHRGSWWPEWMKWLKPYEGEQVPARTIGASIEAAPGSYVKVRAV